jgi:hypothetical protein
MKKQIPLYPNAIQYKDDHSILSYGLADLEISFDHKVIASNLTNLTIGNTVLVAYKDSSKNTVHMFGAIIMEKLDYELTNWSINGGKIWKGNWKIDPITNIRELTTPQIAKIVGMKPSGHIFNQAMGGGGKNLHTIGQPRQKIIDFLRNT